MHTSSWYISITSLRSLANSHLQSKVPRITLWEPAPYFERRCRGPGPSAQQAQTPPSTPPAASSPAHGCQGDPSAGEGVLPCWGPRATRQQDQVEEGPVPGRSQGRNPSGLAVSCPRRPPRDITLEKEIKKYMDRKAGRVHRPSVIKWHLLEF